MWDGTEEEWLTGRAGMVFHEACRSARKLQLLACCHARRRVFEVLQNVRFYDAIELSERYADGQASADDLKREQRTIQMLGDELYSDIIRSLPQPFGHTRQISHAFVDFSVFSKRTVR